MAKHLEHSIQGAAPRKYLTSIDHDPSINHHPSNHQQPPNKPKKKPNPPTKPTITTPPTKMSSNNSTFTSSYSFSSNVTSSTNNGEQTTPFSSPHHQISLHRTFFVSSEKSPTVITTHTRLSFLISNHVHYSYCFFFYLGLCPGHPRSERWNRLMH